MYGTIIVFFFLSGIWELRQHSTYNIHTDMYAQVEDGEKSWGA